MLKKSRRRSKKSSRRVVKSVKRSKARVIKKSGKKRSVKRSKARVIKKNRKNYYAAGVVLGTAVVLAGAGGLYYLNTIWNKILDKLDELNKLDKLDKILDNTQFYHSYKITSTGNNKKLNELKNELKNKLNNESNNKEIIKKIEEEKLKIEEEKLKYDKYFNPKYFRDVDELKKMIKLQENDKKKERIETLIKNIEKYTKKY